MSDPVSNAEIEDVLSSVRRLVSSDDRSEPVGESKDNQETNKLVLTPSLRVSEDGDEEAFDATGIEPDKPLAFILEKPKVRPSDKGSVDEVDTKTVESELVQDAKEASDDETLDYQEEASDDCTEVAEEVSEPTGYEDDPENKSDGEDQADAADHDAPDESAEEADGSLSALEARVAEFEAAVASRDDQWESDGLYEGENAGGSVGTLPWHDHEPADVASSQQDGMDASSDKSEDEIEDAEIIPDTETGDDPVDNVEFDQAGAVLDEAMLRDMVSDIVREELQGELGERITRNVRKLVRREIHRALTAHDLD